MKTHPEVVARPSVRQRALALPTLLGLAIGVLVSIGAASVWSSIDPRGHVAPPSMVRPAMASPPVDVGRDERRVEARLAALEERIAAKGAAAQAEIVTERPKTSNRPAPLSPEDFHQSLLYAHQASRRDPAWSHRAEATFSGRLTELGTQHGFQLMNVDCRESSCTALVEWPTFAAAVSGYPDILHEDYDGMTCQREAQLPDSPRPADPYRATVIFSNCKAPPQPDIEPR